MSGPANPQPQPRRTTTGWQPEHREPFCAGGGAEARDEAAVLAWPAGVLQDVDTPEDLAALADG